MNKSNDIERHVPRLALSIPEAAEALGISRSKMYTLIKSGKIRALRLEGNRRIRVEALQAYLDRCEVAD